MATKAKIVYYQTNRLTPEDAVLEANDVLDEHKAFHPIDVVFSKDRDQKVSVTFGLIRKTGTQPRFTCTNQLQEWSVDHPRTKDAIWIDDVCWFLGVK